MTGRKNRKKKRYHVPFGKDSANGTWYLFFLFCLLWLLMIGAYPYVYAAQAIDPSLEAKEKKEFQELERILLEKPQPALSEKPRPRWWPLPMGKVPVFEKVSVTGMKIPTKVPFSAKLGFPSEKVGPADFPVMTIDPKKIYTVQECTEIAIRNHEPLRVAKKQVELAQAKLAEARRSLFPNATLRGTDTKGETRTAAFHEQEFLFRIEQPLVDGGGLRATLAQAQLNLEVAKKNYDKIFQDVRFETEKNYYELAKAMGQYEVQKETTQTATASVELVKKQFERELVTRLEFLNVQSLYNQLQYQLVSTEKEVTLARMNLQHAMSVEIEPEIQIEFHLEFSTLDEKLGYYQDLALSHRAEIMINSLLAEFHDYGRKVAAAKKKWKVDLAASYGASGGAFEGERLSLGDDWFVGFQVSRPFGLHTLNSSATHQETSPKLGQTDRTESTVVSNELALFNQFPQISEEKELEVSYRQALAELAKIKMTVESEVAEAYFNAQRASILYESQQQRVEFRQRGLAIADLQQKINEVLVSHVLEALLQLAQERAALASALADYHIARVSLNRATGYAL